MNMKKIFNTISVLFAAAILTVSCNVEAVSTIFDETLAKVENTVSFEQAVVVDNEIPATQTTYAISLCRSVAAEAENVKIVSTLPASIVCPATVAFAAGEYNANLVLDISNMSVGETFKGKLTIDGVSDEEKAHTFARLSVDVTLAKAFTWTSLGKGQWLDLFWEGELFDDVEVLKAEGFNIYRFVNPYKDTEAGEGPKPEYVVLTVNADGTFKYDAISTPYLYDDSHAVTAYFPSDASASAADYDAYNVFVQDYYFAFVPYWYVPTVGGWGCKYGYTLFAALPGAPQDIYEWYQANFE